MGVVGVVVLLAIAFALSSDRRHALKLHNLAWGMGLQIAIALFALKSPWGARFFVWTNDAANAFVGFADAGIRFVFGAWPDVAAVSTPDAAAPGGLRTVVVGFVLAVRVLPLIVFIASLMAILYHLRIMQAIVGLLARGLARTMRISG